MNTRTKKQLVVLSMVAILLVLLIVAATFLMPGGAIRKIIKNPAKQETVNNNVVNKYDFIGQIFDADMNPIANTSFGISCGPTEFVTDENGYFRLNGLPVGVYNIYLVKDGQQIGVTEIQLSNDGCFTVGYVFFELGTVVTMIFDGTQFVGFIPEENPPAEDLPSEEITDDTSEDEPTEEPVEEDETYTNLSWMKDVPFGFGAYGINTTYNPELFIEVVTNPEYDYINTFLIDGGVRMDQAKFEAEYFAKYDKNFFLNVHGLLSYGSKDINTNLKGDWRSQLKKWSAILYDIAGDNFQGFYFDEVDLYLNEKDFTRVTKYMRETFGLRTFAVHRRDPFTIPAGVGTTIDKYRGSKFVIDSENHKYVTDVGWWWYGGYDFYGYNAVRLGDLWAQAMKLLDPNTRKWIVPPIGSFDFRHNEEDCLEVAYAMYREASKVEGFGGLMFYSMQAGGLWGGYTEIQPEDPRLTEKDYVKENGEFVYVEKKDKNGNIVYEKDENGEEKLDKDGNKIPVMTRVVDVKVNHSLTNHRDGQNNYSVEGCANYWIMTKNDKGEYNWPRARKYFEIIGKGITSGESRTSILAKLDKVFKPDYSKFK